MSDNNFINHILNVVYGVVILLIALGVILFFMWLYVKIKRWYCRARIASTKKDFNEKITDYIIKNRRKPKPFQKFILGQTGEIIEYKYLIGFGIFLIVCFLLGRLLGSYDSNPIFSNPIFTIGWYIFSFTLLMYTSIMWKESLKELIKFARVLSFIFWTAMLILYIIFAVGNISHIFELLSDA